MNKEHHKERFDQDNFRRLQMVRLVITFCIILFVLAIVLNDGAYFSLIGWLLCIVTGGASRLFARHSFIDKQACWYIALFFALFAGIVFVLHHDCRDIGGMVVSGVWMGGFYGGSTFLGIGVVAFGECFHTPSTRRMGYGVLLPLGILLALPLLNLYDLLGLNPILFDRAERELRDYVTTAYGGQYEVSDVWGNFKFNHYGVTVSDPDSMDRHFQVTYRNDAPVVIRYFTQGDIHDSYEEEVARCGNTFERLSEEFQTHMRPILAESFIQKNHYHLDALNSTAEVRQASGRLKRKHARLRLDMPCTPQSMPCTTSMYLDVRLDREEAFRSVHTLAADLQALGYRIDEYDIELIHPVSDHAYLVQRYADIPREELLAAESLDELEAYKTLERERKK